MRSINNPHLAQLLMQLKFVSAAKRSEYLKSAQDLFYSLEPQKEYPFDFICFRITGYHPKDLPEELIDGKRLAEDLKVFIWKLSGKVNELASTQNEKVFSVNELAQSLNVSSKTISRWRSKGLLARKYIFEDGKKRLAVLSSELERFFNLHPNLKEAASDFERLGNEEKAKAVLLAREIAENTKLSKYKVIQAVADNLHRGHETIRKLLLEYDTDRRRGRIFKSAKEHLRPEDKKEIFRLYRQGVPVKEIVKQFGKCKAEIYRVINQKKAKELIAMKIEFIYSEEFRKDDAFETIAAGDFNKNIPQTTAADKLKLDDNSISKYLQSVKTAERFTRDTETQLFRKYNYLKYLASAEKSKINIAKVSGRHLKVIEKYLAEAESIKKSIIEANLGLVINIANKHSLSGVSIGELISEGNMALMRAVEKFDYTKGFRFLTYASWIISKEFARKIPADKAQSGSKAAEAIENVQKNFRIADAVDFGVIERARSSLVQVIKDELNAREQHVVLWHYGLMSESVIKSSKTLKEIGDDLGLTRERVRQIELTALQKLKQSLSAEEFELLTG